MHFEVTWVRICLSGLENYQKRAQVAQDAEGVADDVPIAWGGLGHLQAS